MHAALPKSIKYFSALHNVDFVHISSTEASARDEIHFEFPLCNFGLIFMSEKKTSPCIPKTNNLPRIVFRVVGEARGLPALVHLTLLKNSPHRLQLGGVYLIFRGSTTARLGL